MNSDEESRFNVYSEDLRKYNWQQLIADHPNKTCDSYEELFRTAAEQYRESGDELGERVCMFLSTIASFIPDIGNKVAPYRPMVQWPDGRRSLIPDDLVEQDLNALKGIITDIQDSEFRARVADVLWICCKDYQAAKLAINSFIDSAEILRTRGERWPLFIDRLYQAMHRSAGGGFEEQRERLINLVEASLAEFNTDLKSGLLCDRLMSILLYLKVGDANHYVSLSENLAKEFSREQQWEHAKEYWQVAAEWHRRNGDEAAARHSAIQAAECDISSAKDEIKKQPPRTLRAVHLLASGLEGLRRAKADSSRIKEIHRELLSLQKRSQTEFEPIDLFKLGSMRGFIEKTEYFKDASIQLVSGLEFSYALIQLAYMREPTDFERLRADELKNLEGLVWHKLMGVTQLDRDGKVADTRDALAFDGDPEQFLRKKLAESARQSYWPLAVDCQIEPARSAIAKDHPVRRRDLIFLVANNPFIPPGREGIYLRGIQAGFFGDWLLAMHLLIPQIEASLRYVLQQHGEVTSTLDSDGLQKERDINQLLWYEPVERIFGPDVIFDLRGILIEKFGSNMRNDLAHGLMPEAAFQCVESVYLWWLVIRLCFDAFKTIPEEMKDI